MIHMENRNTETIKMMYLEDRPYEKCEQYGAEHLTDVELLAVLLRTGTKGRIRSDLPRRFCIHHLALKDFSASHSGLWNSY